MPPGGYAVVNYHGVIPAGCSSTEKFLDGNLVRPEVLRVQLQFLKARYRVIAPEDFRACIEQCKPFPPRSVLVTCDDGLLNTLTEMLPILEEEDVQCLFFVTTASCGENPGMLWYDELYHLMRNQPLGELAAELPAEESSAPAPDFQAQWWSVVRRASQLMAESRAEWMSRVRAKCGPSPTDCEKRWRLLNIRELTQLAAGGMTIGSHTRTHPVLAMSSDEAARREIHESKIEIERALGKTVWAFAYPFGNPATMGEREFSLAQQAGFSCAFLNVEHWAGQESNPLAIARTHISADMSLSEFDAHLSGLHARLQRAVGG
jgi:peptidoglycan/xylan/chitin deacetylase (PgdA/CDA1 family)